MIKKYLIVILNYNSYNDTLKAVKSLILTHQRNNYIICVADNCSSERINVNELLEIANDKIEVLEFHYNYGYAKGNNKAIIEMSKRYSFNFVCVMNPDIIIESNNIIDDLINRLEANKNNNTIVGVQPLVWNYLYSQTMNQQVNIRRVPTLKDMYILSFYFLRLVFTSRYNYYVYKDLMPYKDEITFEVPSGAFFIINYKKFLEVNLFDEKTFLYNEEPILGFKLKQKNKTFLFCPQYYVKHTQGTSIGSNRYRKSWFAQKNLIASTNYYIKNYLKKSKIHIIFITFLYILDYLIRKLISFFIQNKKRASNEK